MEIVVDFIFLDFKITMDDNCSHEIKRRLLLGRKAMTNLDSNTQTFEYTDRFRQSDVWCVCPGVGLLGHMAVPFPAL